MSGRSRQRESRATASAKPVKDTVVFRSDVSPAEVKSPVMRSADKVRDYFSQYGSCDVIFEHHQSVRGLDRHTMVIQFKETSVANKVKQKYNGRVLFDARITTSWLDLRQMRDLGMPQQGWEKPRENSALWRGRSSRSSPLYSREDFSSPATGSKYHSSSSLTSASYSTSGTDTESSVESGYAHDSSPSVTKFQGVTRLEQSSRLSPAGPPVSASSPLRDRSPARNRKKSSSSPYSRRHGSQERSDSRVGSRSSKDRDKDRETSRQREKASSPKYSTRLRSKRKLSDTDKGAAQSTSTEGPRSSRPSRGSVPYSKPSRDDSSDSQGSKGGDLKSSKTVFERLGPTKLPVDETDQIEKYGDTKLKGKKHSGSSLLSPERRGGLKSPTSDQPSSSKQTSGGSDKDVKASSEKDSTPQISEKGKDAKDARSSRGSRARTRSQSSHGKSKSTQKAGATVTESSVGKEDVKASQENTPMDTQEKDRAADARPLVRPAGESKDKESRADQVVDTGVQEGQQGKEHPQEKTSKEKDNSHQLLPRTKRLSLTEEVEAIPRHHTEQSSTEHTAPTADTVRSDIAGAETQRQKKSAIDYRAMKESVMKEFDEHAEILVTSCKILSTQNLTSQQLVESSLETSLMHLAATFMAKFQERATAAKASQK